LLFFAAEHLDKLEEALLSKWSESEPKCPICQNSDWTVSPQIFEIEDFLPVATLGRKTVFPVIVIVCSKCSYCLMFSAIALGLLPSSSIEEAKKEPES
jgi:hypothetical protein